MSEYNPLKASTFHVARLVVEAETAFAISTGMGEAGFDNLLVRDANGLPTIPGTSLAGVFRSNFEALFDDEHKRQKDTDDLFGHIVARSDEGSPSRVQFSYGCIHDSADRPIEGLIDVQKIADDPLLSLVAGEHPQIRERVTINTCGVAENHKKFDVTTVPAGCRFSIEISLFSLPGQDAAWQQLLDLMQNEIRLGSSTSSGLGLFKAVRLHHRNFNLRDRTDYANFASLSANIADTSDLIDATPACNSSSQPDQQYRLTLNAEDFWRIGQGNTPLTDQSADAIPMSDTRIQWSKDGAKPCAAQLLIPGTGIKGPLRHRTLFHIHKHLLQLNGDESQGKSGDYSLAKNERKQHAQQLLDSLFGSAGNTEADKTTGNAGALIFRDVYLSDSPPRQVKVITHNSINRFSGGVRNQVLYSEELLWQDKFELTVAIKPQRWKAADRIAKEAFVHALDDLCSGRLALGAGDAKGHGYFSGSINHQPILA